MTYWVVNQHTGQTWPFVTGDQLAKILRKQFGRLSDVDRLIDAWFDNEPTVSFEDALGITIELWRNESIKAALPNWC